jgi:hypothetical protein
VARVLAEALSRYGCKVWYDEYSLRPGDSISERIHAGLKRSKHVVLILSPSFLSKGGWSKREYDIAYTRELVQDERVLLPVWCGISVQDLYAFSPILCDRMAANWGDGEQVVCHQLYLAISGTRRVTSV